MKKSFKRTNFVDLLGADAKMIWGASFTVDEHEAFILAYRLLGGRITDQNAHLTFERRGFRRAGQGIIPRAWLHPFDVPVDRIIPTYHPKLLLIDSPAGHELAVSTGNFASDDLRHTRNLAVHFDVSPSVAKRTAAWIERKPSGHRALCFLVTKEGIKPLRPSGNASTLNQFTACLSRCPACRKGRSQRGEWVVAAPFWSPGALVKMLTLDPEGAVEAYFRTRSVWEQIARGAVSALGGPALKRVAAYELLERGDVQRWHHKVVGWRCCAGAGAHSALYVGSANATTCGFFGQGSRAVNWESGVIWTGGAALWEHARSVARAGFSARHLPTPDESGDEAVRADDEIGALDCEEMERLFAAHLGRFIRVNRKSREIGRYRSKPEQIRILGCYWSLRSVRLRFEDRTQIRDGGVLKPGGRRRVPEKARAQVHCLFERKLDAGGKEADLPQYAEATVDIAELDPPPKIIPADRRSAIASALAGLWWTEWNHGSGNGQSEANNVGEHSRDDVRFPFADYYALEKRRPLAAAAWIDRIVTSDEPALEKLPKHWRAIAEQLRQNA